MAPPRLSGLQRQVLALYRSALRAAARHPDATTRSSVKAYARHQLETHRALPRADVMRIEHLLRQGGKQLAQLADPGFSGFAWRQPAAHAGRAALHEPPS
jgi:succinate dehydrogenase assembly factor 1